MTLDDVLGDDRKFSEVVTRTVSPTPIDVDTVGSGVGVGVTVCRNVPATQPVPAAVDSCHQLWPSADCGPAMTVPSVPVVRTVIIEALSPGAVRMLTLVVVRTVSPTAAALTMPRVGMPERVDVAVACPGRSVVGSGVWVGLGSERTV
jgi:hypothetical protein